LLENMTKSAKQRAKVIILVQFLMRPFSAIVPYLSFYLFVKISSESWRAFLGGLIEGSVPEGFSRQYLFRKRGLKKKAGRGNCVDRCSAL
jgi:hypothetical protein